MARELSRREPRSELKEEGNLLVEAVALLVQRQRETETWVAEQIWQADERAAATERRYAELEARLVEIEAHLARLAHDLEPQRGDPVVEERLARLREQVEGLKAAAPDGPPARPAPASPPADSDTTAVASGRSVRTPVEPRAAAATAGGSSVGFWELLGPTPQERFGFLLIAAGAVAILYLILSLLRFG